MRTVVGVFPGEADAASVAHDLNALGISLDDINIVGRGNKLDHEAVWSRRNLAAAAGCGWGWFIAALIPTVAERSRGVATAFGAALGGGLIAGITALAIHNATQVPGDYRWAIIATALGIGAAAGGLAAGIYNTGVSREQTPLHEEAVRERGVVVSAHVDEFLEDPALKIMNDHHARNVRIDADAWLASGWKGPYNKDALYPSDSTVRTH